VNNPTPMPKHRPKKRLGQNFLHDRDVLQAILEAAELGPEDQVLEIGPGRGALTEVLAPHAGKIVAVEIDRGLQNYLARLSDAYPQLEVRFADFMKVDWADLGFDPAKPVKVVANIPYYITTPILMKLLQATRLEREPLVDVTPHAERILLMVQWEVAKRMTAPPGNKDYGSLSLITQYAADVSLVVKVPGTSFFPVPEVDSAVVMLKPRKVPSVQVDDIPRMFRAIRGSFQQRRKTLQNGLLSAGFTREQLVRAAGELKLDMGRRAETLSLAEFAALANALGPQP
jgi:16S rRNA (adenine1518-N6/adenine1519-N6)-dimethyltransferase